MREAQEGPSGAASSWACGCDFGIEAPLVCCSGASKHNLVRRGLYVVADELRSRIRETGGRRGGREVVNVVVDTVTSNKMSTSARSKNLDVHPIGDV